MSMPWLSTSPFSITFSLSLHHACPPLPFFLKCIYKYPCVQVHRNVWRAEVSLSTILRSIINLETRSLDVQGLTTSSETRGMLGSTGLLQMNRDPASESRVLES